MKTCSLKLKQAALITGIALTGIGSVTPANALTFNFVSSANIDQQALAGFQQAGALWSSLFTDNVTIDIHIDYTALGANILGEAGSSEQSYTYTQVYSALNNQPKSADDVAAISHLSNGSTFNLLLNRTSNSPNGSGNATPYLDNNGNANNSTITMNTANAKALGLATAPTASGYDAEITFSNLFGWDFNRANGITAGTYDFVGVAAHEIGHALGFISGVDVLDYNSPPHTQAYPDSEFTFVNTLDLFRYSTQSATNGVIDWTADNRAKYFSLDGGATNIALFSNGVNFGGDGRQASHWKDNLNIGIMDPTTADGELINITDNDKRAMDVIGWDLASNNNATSVPEPANFIGTFIFAAFGAKLVLKRRQKRFDSSEN